jgi:hypothetical protein
MLNEGRSMKIHEIANDCGDWRAPVLRGHNAHGRAGGFSFLKRAH